MFNITDRRLLPLETPFRFLRGGDPCLGPACVWRGAVASTLTPS